MAKEAQIEHSKGAEAQKKPRTRRGAQDPDAGKHVRKSRSLKNLA